MPTKVSQWRCKHCGAYWEVEGHARVCEASHVDLSDLKIAEVLPDSNGFKFKHGAKLPSSIVVSNKEGTEKVVYVRPSQTRVNLDRPTMAEGIRLRPKE